MFACDVYFMCDECKVVIPGVPVTTSWSGIFSAFDLDEYDYF